MAIVIEICIKFRLKTGNLAPKKFEDSIIDFKGGVKLIKTENELLHQQV